MVRIAKETDPIKLEELREKIHDEKYLALAIHQLAQILSTEIVEIDEESKS
ncbi:MAG: hypothetical protein FWD87_09080 [Spirochaetaceae bacterium]|nr:hypothetical protein [Spirochaetaceae bacterium]